MCDLEINRNRTKFKYPFVTKTPRKMPSRGWMHHCITLSFSLCPIEAILWSEGGTHKTACPTGGASAPFARKMSGQKPHSRDRCTEQVPITTCLSRRSFSEIFEAATTTVAVNCQTILDRLWAQDLTAEKKTPSFSASRLRRRPPGNK